MSIFPDLSAADPEHHLGVMRPPGFAGVLFGDASVGDVRRDPDAYGAFVACGAPQALAFANQVHGTVVIEARTAGAVGDCDALITTTPGLAVAVATADCVPVVIVGPGFAAVVHAGWRGASAGVIGATLGALDARGLVPERAAIGPAIGPCCYEVGTEVTAALPDHVATTEWATASVDLISAASSQLGAIPTWVSDRCTRTDRDLYSYRRDHTSGRQVAVAWLQST